jgi:hypothetical protein
VQCFSNLFSFPLKLFSYKDRLSDMYTCADSNTDSAKGVTSDGLEVVQPGLERVGYTRQPYEQQAAGFNHSEEKAHIFAPALPQEMICGLRKVTFWLSLAITALAIIVVGVAIGLGVGLSQANKSNSKMFFNFEYRMLII